MTAPTGPTAGLRAGVPLVGRLDAVARRRLDERPSQTCEWIDHTGAARTQFMAGEAALAEHAEAVRRFAATHPVVEAPRRAVELGVTGDQYYADPLGWARRLYDEFLAQSC